MSRYRFRREAGESAVEAWRPLDRAVYRWVRGHGGSEALASVAAWASFADGQGDAALALAEADARHGMPPLPADAITALRAEPMVADEDVRQPTPFVLDAAGRFYLGRNHAHERAVADAIIERLRVSTLPTTEAGYEADLDHLFAGSRGADVAAQRQAVRAVPGRRLFVLTGGPGTGKTTTVLRMLLMLQRQAGRPLDIRVAAPTGKAAQRLVQSLRDGKRELLDPARAPLPDDWRALLDAVPDAEAPTLHRLLGYQPWRNAFRRGARDPLAADVVVVDEASMIDLATLHALLDAVRPEASLILVGDADQLSSVATGSALMDLVAAFEHDGVPELARLRHSFRAERALAVVNEAVRAGDADGLDAAIAAAGAQVAWREVADERALGVELARWTQALAEADLRPCLPSARADDAAAHRARLARQALATLAQRQLLCALREDAFGALAANASIERRLRRDWGIAETAEWYAGRAVIVTRNDYATGLFNGDVGLCLADEDGQLQVWFEAASQGGEAAEAAMRSFAPHALPPHETAFAITIHKSQGSEYRRAAVLLPPDPAHRILSRQLLYTGVSRAKAALEIWATPAALRAALAQPVRRVGGLADRLRRGVVDAKGGMP